VIFAARPTAWTSTAPTRSRQTVNFDPWTHEHAFPYAVDVADLPIPELVENWRRSIAMLAPGMPALTREEEALELLSQFEAALLELRRLESASR
jgi:hypothetical protein